VKPTVRIEDYSSAQLSPQSSRGDSRRHILASRCFEPPDSADEKRGETQEHGDRYGLSGGPGKPWFQKTRRDAERPEGGDEHAGEAFAGHETRRGEDARIALPATTA
jgi:hypothetical protein